MRNLLTIYLTKLTYIFIKILHLGSGYTWPGELALRLNSNILKNNKFYPKNGFIFISGTNGKTTTSKLISHVLRKQGLSVITNESGANLLNGVCSSLCLNATIFGNSKADWAVFEVDEFALPVLIKHIKPEVLLLLNLSRDQLDRYGETDIILEKWENMLSALPADTHLVYDVTQDKFKNFPNLIRGNMFTFDAAVSNVSAIGLYGGFNAKNLNAAFVVCSILDISVQQVLLNLKDFVPAWGRGESLSLGSTFFRIFLAKNPMSFNSNLELLALNNFEVDTFLFILNDNIPDGRDISWIYDIDPEKLRAVCVGKNIFITGTRAYDLGVRLFYAGIQISPAAVIPNIRDCIAAIKKDTNVRHVTALPNYSAMLDLRKILTGKKIL